MMAIASGRPAPWAIWAAVGAIVVTAVSVLGPLLSNQYRKYKELRVDEQFRPIEHLYDLTRVARLAARSPSRSGIEQGRWAALELLRMSERLRGDWDYGNAVHYSHLVLGRLALLDGDVDRARKQLLAAADTPGSPQLDDYGPDMTLAEELLRRGETAVVLEYFSKCGKSWLNKENNRLAEWSSAVRAGQMPAFGMRSGLHAVRGRG